MNLVELFGHVDDFQRRPPFTELAQHTVWCLVLIVVGWMGLFLVSVRDRDERATQRKRPMPKRLYAVAQTRPRQYNSSGCRRGGMKWR